MLDADVVINLPKMKTHKKTAVTLSLKSVIGLTNEKYWLPHFTAGDPSMGGDEYDRPQELSDRIREALGGKLLPTGRLETMEEVLDGPAPHRRFKAPRSWPSLVE